MEEITMKIVLKDMSEIHNIVCINFHKDFVLVETIKDILEIEINNVLGITEG